MKPVNVFPNRSIDWYKPMDGRTPGNTIWKKLIRTEYRSRLRLLVATLDGVYWAVHEAN